jgi:hypothetical protein
MIAPIFDCMFASAAPMLPVVSARNTTSGLGGITGVFRVFSMVMLPPGAAVPMPALSGSNAAELRS